MPSNERRGFVRTALVALAALVSRPKSLAASQTATLLPATLPPAARIGRRVITGVDAKGRSRIDSEAPVPASAMWKDDDGAQGMDFWAVRQLPTRLNGPLEPPANWELANHAPAGGLIGRLITWPPGFTYPSHSTPTLDLGVIVSGRLELILDTGTTILNPGDVLVQRGTAHGWRVVGPEPCTWVVIMADARPRAR